MLPKDNLEVTYEPTNDLCRPRASRSSRKDLAGFRYALRQAPEIHPPRWLPYYGETFGGIDLKVILALKKISAPSLDRLLKPARRKHKLVALSTTKPGTLLRNHIPVKTGQWEESEPGFIEIDTVAHCGTSAAGQFVCTLDAVDIATGWIEQRAVWGTGERGDLEQIKDIEASLPFPLRGLDSDNGHEFLNWHLVKYCQERKEPVTFTRSRAYKKDDNAKTPYQRILQHPSVAPHRKAELTKMFQKLNPFKLRLTIDKKLDKIRSLASKSPLKLNPSLGNILQ